MKLSKAIVIFENVDDENMTIDNQKVSDEDKALAIYEVLKMPTYMSIKKDSMMKVIKWLFDRCWEVEGAEQK